MVNVLLIHDTDSNPRKFWYPWLAESLEEIGVTVRIPKLPKDEKNNMNSILAVLHNFDTYLSKNSIVVCHGNGWIPGIHWILENNRIIRSLFLVSPVFLKAPEINWDELRKSVKIIETFYSKKQSTENIEKQKLISKKLSAKEWQIEDSEYPDNNPKPFGILLERIERAIKTIN